MFGYIIQTVTDAKTGLIIIQNVAEEQTNTGQLIQAIDYIKHTYGKTPQYLLADNRYYKIKSPEYTSHKRITTLVPDRSKSMNKNITMNNNSFVKHSMPFDSTNNNFTCPKDKN